MGKIETALTEMATLIKALPLTVPPDQRVWTHPAQASAISMSNLPAVVISKMNTQPGAWSTESFGVGQHIWDILIACYVEDGPIVVTSSDEQTVRAMKNANEWYKLLADTLFENMTLNGSVDIVGDEDGSLFGYVTDNILWDGRQYYGHLFFVPVTQTVIQGVSS